MQETNILTGQAFLSELLTLSTQETINQNTLTEIAQRICAHFELSRISISEINANQKSLTILYAFDFKQGIINTITNLNVDFSSIPTLKNDLMSNEDLVVNDITQMPESVIQYFNKNEVKSYFSAMSPIFNNKKLRITFQSTFVRDFSKQDIYILKLAAQFITSNSALIIANKELTTIQTTISELGFIAHLHNIIADHIDKELALNKAIETVCNFFEIDFSTILTKKEDYEPFHIWTQPSNDLDFDIKKNKDYSFVLDSLWDKGFISINDIKTLDIKSQEYFKSQGIFSFIAFTITSFSSFKALAILGRNQISSQWTSHELSALKTVSLIIETLWANIDASKQELQKLQEQDKSSALEASSRSMEIILNSSPDGLCVIDPVTCKIIFINKLLADYMYNDEADFANSCPLLLPDINISCNNCPIKKLIENPSQEEFSEEYYISKLKQWVFTKYSLVQWIDGETVGLVRISNITAQKNQELMMRDLAYNDQLLGIPNRLQFNKDISQFIQTQSHGAIILFDLDNFKYINDTYGHEYGNMLLKSVCSYLRTLQAPDRYFYHFSGNKFAIILDKENEENVNEFCKQLLSKFRIPWDVHQEHQYCTASFGVVFYPKDGNDLDIIIKNSEITMYHSKSIGKNTLSYFSHELDNRFKERVKLEECLRYAIVNSIEEFELLYQPIMNIVTDKCIGAEALLRWNSKELGLLSPNQFIRIVEDIGFVVPLGERIFEVACKQLKEWQSLFDKEFKMNINVSNRQLKSDNFLQVVRNAIDKNGLSSRFVVLEVTETVDPIEVGTINEILAALKKVGISIAMDDFGTGYSSLNNIMNMVIDIIKIDRSFITNITSDRLLVRFVKSITNLSQMMHKKIYIEGVETLEQLNILKGMGNITTVQGYYYAKPLSADAFVNWYNENFK